MRIGRSYKQNTIHDHWDAIVIGSGVGGLATACMLARHQDKRVLVLERHYTAGGFTHTFNRPNYEWDVGVHYVGEVMRSGSLMRRIFDHLTNSELLWADMGEVYDTIVINQDRYEFVRGEAAFRARMKSYFPSDAQAIDRYLARIKSAAKHSRNFFMEKALPPLLSQIMGPVLRWPALLHASKTVAEVFQEVGIKPGSRLAGVLSGQLGDYGLPPKQASFFMHAILVTHYINGGAYPVGGSSQIASTMTRALEAQGGLVATCAEVGSILFSNQKAKGVKMLDGREIYAPIIISDAGFALTYGKLVPQELSASLGIQTDTADVPPSLSHAALYVGINKDSSSLGLSASNIWLYPHEDHDANMQAYINNPEAPLPLVYLSFPAAKDPTFSTRFPGRSTIEAIGLAPWKQFAAFAESRWKKREAAYEKLKQDLSDRLLQSLYQECPKVIGHIDHAELSTPLSTKHFMAHPEGEIYGLSHVPARFKLKALRPRTPLFGLYLTGSDICTAGVGGALMGGIITASVIAKKNLFAKALKSHAL